MRLSEKKRCALVLSGGGIKAAAFHIGVCMALKEKGFQFAGGSKSEVTARFESDRLTFKVYVGSSAGSVICTFLASGYTLEEIIDAFMKGSGFRALIPFIFKQKNRLKPITYRDIFALNSAALSRFPTAMLLRKPVVSGGLEVLLKHGINVNGIFSARNIERYIREHVVQENHFLSLGVDLYVIGTQLNYPKKAIFGPFAESNKQKNVDTVGYAKISEAVAASAALPPVFAPYGIKNDEGEEVHYFDGEIRDTLSTHVASDHGADLVISSYSFQPYHYSKEIGSLEKYGIPLILNQALYQVIEQKVAREIEHQQQARAVIQTVDGYFKQQNLPDEHRVRLLDILKVKTSHREGVEYIYIHPAPEDFEMFFVDHFSLSPSILSRIVRIGFKAGMRVLRKLNI